METLDFLNKFTTIIVSIIVLLVAFLTYLSKGRIKFGKLGVEFDKNVEFETARLLGELHSPSPNLQSDEKKYALLLQYHSQGLAQSKISFWFSLVFASIGFVIIVIGILTVDKDVALLQQGRTFITLLSGTIIDAISALFFVQSNKARQLMTDFFDKLRADRKFEESLKLSNEIPDAQMKSRLKALLAINFADIKSDDGTLRELYSQVKTTKEENK